jgi:ribosomal protein S18 acetylase RimI-like enzyme
VVLAEFEVVSAGVEDERDIIPLMSAFNDDEGIVWQPATMVPALRRLLQEPALGVVLIAREHGSRAAVGYGIATFGYDVEHSGRDAFIAELFVESRHRRRGIGRLLLESLVATLRGHDVNAVHLMVRPENVQARALYESLEFRLVPRLLMTRRLGP